jgi:hypothetical protein
MERVASTANASLGERRKRLLAPRGPQGETSKSRGRPGSARRTFIVRSMSSQALSSVESCARPCVVAAHPSGSALTCSQASRPKGEASTRPWLGAVTPGGAFPGRGSGNEDGQRPACPPGSAPVIDTRTGDLQLWEVPRASIGGCGSIHSRAVRALEVSGTAGAQATSFWRHSRVTAEWTTSRSS